MKTESIDFRKTVTVRLLKGLPSYVKLTISTLFFNVLRIGLHPFIRWQILHHTKQINQIVIFGFGGVGNHLMLIPAIRMIRQQVPEAHVHVIATSSACAEILMGSRMVNSVSVADMHSPRTIRKYIKLTRIMKTLTPDVVIGASGLDPVFVGMVSFLGGARQRVGADWRGRGFLFSHRIKLDGKEYEAVQNLKLVEALFEKSSHHAIDIPKFHLDKSHLMKGQEWKAALNLNRDGILVGLHPGSGNEQKWKRWDLDSFIELAKDMERKYRCHCIFFLGPDEKDMEKTLSDKEVSESKIARGDHSILHTASRILQCQLFIANDSGLRQIAVSLGVPTIGIFGPTSTEKNFVSDDLHEAIIASHVLCRPCHYTRWWLACGTDQRCLKDITVEMVMARAATYIQRLRRSDAGIK